MGRRTGRRRPRVRSAYFGTLDWLLVREAALRVLCPYDDLPGRTEYLRAKLCDQQTVHIKRDMRAMLARDPWRRHYPQPALFPTAELERARATPPR